MIEMLRTYSKGFLENGTIEEVPPLIHYRTPPCDIRLDKNVLTKKSKVIKHVY